MFTARSVQSGRWSDPNTWAGKHLPAAGDRVQIRTGHRVTYDVAPEFALRMVHVAGNLTFAQDRTTRLRVGLLKVQPGEDATEDGFACDMHSTPEESDPKAPRPVLEVGTTESPLPPRFSATLQLVYFPGMDKETLPAIINCGGRWDLHGAPLSRTWVKLGAHAKPGATQLTLAEPVTGWQVGDRVIVTASRAPQSKVRQTEERQITQIEGTAVTLNQPLQYEHDGTGEYRSELADLSRNVVVESADPNGVRGHTMYHKNSGGSLSYAEFRHLGKEGVLGKYPIHFHLIGGTMRASGVVGASVWDSRNRWITIHGTDGLLVRDCVGYQSVGHGFFLEDGTEQDNILDRNLACQANRGKKLPKQVLPFDENEGAGFWWANGNNTLVRNVACETETYGFRFEIGKRSNYNPTLELRRSDGTTEKRDVRTIPFLRFEANESHSEGLYSFNFGDDQNPSVRGDRQHPFIVRNLKAWETHYVLRPNLQFFLLDGLTVHKGVYGIYHPDYDAHVYRNILLDDVNSEPINRGHDDDSIQYGSFTYENLTLLNCQVGRDPLIQLTCTSPNPGQTGHFRNLVLRSSRSRVGQVVDLGGGPRNDKLQYGVAYYFHDHFGPGQSARVVSAKFPDLMQGSPYAPLAGFTGPDVRAAQVPNPAFPTLLEPIDDLPPTTLVLSLQTVRGKWVVRGVTQDNGELASVSVNGQKVTPRATAPGLLDWEVTLTIPRDGKLHVTATDRAGNTGRF